MIENTIIGGAH